MGIHKSFSEIAAGIKSLKGAAPTADVDEARVRYYAALGLEVRLEEIREEFADMSEDALTRLEDFEDDVSLLVLELQGKFEDLVQLEPEALER